MAVTSVQATQYENQASSLNSRANNISNVIDNYVASVNTNSVLGSSRLAERSDGLRLEIEAQETLNNILLFLNRNEVREGQSDLVYGTRITDAVAQAREAKAIAQAALDTIRASLSAGRLGFDEKTDTDSVGLIASDDNAGREPGAATQTPPLESEFSSLKKITPTNANKTQTQQVGGLPSDDLAGTKFNEDRGRSTGGNLVGQGDVKYPGAFEQDIQAKLNSLAGMAT